MKGHDAELARAIRHFDVNDESIQNNVAVYKTVFCFGRVLILGSRISIKTTIDKRGFIERPVMFYDNLCLPSKPLVKYCRIVYLSF